MPTYARDRKKQEQKVKWEEDEEELKQKELGEWIK